MDKMETAICKDGHIFYSGYCYCPICKIYEDCDKEDKEKLK